MALSLDIALQVDYLGKGGTFVRRWSITRHLVDFIALRVVHAGFMNDFHTAS